MLCCLQNKTTVCNYDVHYLNSTISIVNKQNIYKYISICHDIEEKLLSWH